MPYGRLVLRFWFQEADITGRSFCLAFVGGAAWVQCVPVLPGAFVLSLTGIAGGVAAVVLAVVSAGVAAADRLRCRAGSLRVVCALVLGLCAGTLNACLQAHLRLDDSLADLHQDQVSRLTLRVAELPDGDGRHHRFIAERAEPARPGIPSRIQVTWQAPPGATVPLPALLPGQIWRMALVLRRPHGVLNPAGPDAEGRMFARGLRAVGTVRGRPQLLDDKPWASAGVAIERARHHVREGLRQALGEHRYAPVLIALAIGDQAGVALVNDNKVLFQRAFDFKEFSENVEKSMPLKFWPRFAPYA